MKRVLKAFIFLVVLAGLTGLSGALYQFHFKIKPEMIRGFIAKAAPPPATVAAAHAETAKWVPGLTAIGSARAFQGVDISSQLPGIITAIHIGSGQDVQKEAPLFDLDTSVERADLKSNMATLTNVDVALGRQKTLMAGGNTSRANLDSAQATRDQAAAAVERTKATIAQKTLVAPFAGRLGIRKADVGQYASSGMSLITLQQLDPIFVDFPMPEQALDRLKGGQTVEVKVDAYPGTVFRGKIDLIDARVASESRSVLVRALFDNRDHRLLPGMFTNVTVIAGAPHEVVAVPRTAVSFSLYGDSVYVLTPKPVQTASPEPQPGSAQAAPAKVNSAKVDSAKVDSAKVDSAKGDSAKPVFVATRRFVRTGETKDGKIEILDGLKVGETVVAEGQIKLQNGAAVVIDPSAKLVPPDVRPKE